MNDNTAPQYIGKPTGQVFEFSVTGEAIPKPNSYTIWSPSQFFAFKIDPSAILLGDGYLERGEWTSLVGIGGLGKTRLLLWLCICQITNRKWCDLQTKGTPQKCLLLSTESGLRRWKTDLEKIYSILTQEEKNLVESNLRLLALTPDEEGDLNLGDPANVERLKATLKTENPGIIGFDPFADMVDGDENKTVDMVTTLRTLKQIHRTSAPNAAAIIVHHARTGSGNIVQAGNLFAQGNFGRGAKALYSRVRCELQLAPGDKDNANLLVLACGKSNNGEKFAPRGIVFDSNNFTYSVDEDFDLEAWRSDVDGKRDYKSATIADVVNVVRDLCKHTGDEVKAGEICDKAHATTAASTRTIKTRIKEALKAGYLRNGKVKGAYGLGSKPLKT